MKILFFNPPFKGRFSRSSRSPAVTKGGTLYYPIWLAYAAGVSEKAGHDVRLYDAPAEGIELKDLFIKMGDFTPDIVVIDTSTPSILSDARCAGDIKGQYPDATVVLVGTHPSALPLKTLDLNPGIDAVALGEYDYTIRDLANSLENETPLDGVDGFAFRKTDRIFRNRDREKIRDLDELPFVSSVYRRHLDHRNYFFAAAKYPMVMIITGRGCPFGCFFCVYPQVFHSREYRARSPENVVEEFEYIRSDFPDVKEIGIEDDCFTANPGRVEEICEMIIQRNINIKWYCNVRGDLDYPLLKLMKRAGCRLVTVGFESGCQDVLDNIHKGEKVNNYYKFAQAARKAGVLVHGCIMTGNPGDSKETMKKSYEFAKKINCDSMQFYPLYVYPGTRAYEWALKQKYLVSEDYSQWLTKEGLHNCVLNTPELSSTDMVRLSDYYLKKYHLRPKYLIMKLMQAVRNPSEGYRSLKSAKVLFSRMLYGEV